MTDNITPQNDNDHGFLFLLLLVTLFMSSCSTKRCVTEKDSVMIVKTDTVTTTTVKKETVWRDRMRDRYVVVNALGDTVRDIQKEYVHLTDTVHDTVRVVEKNHHEGDRTRINNTQAKARSPTKITVIEFWCFIAVVIFMMVFFFHKKHNKT